MTTSPVARSLTSVAVALVLTVLLMAGPLAPKASAASAVPLLDATFATLLNTLRSTLGLGSLAVDPQLSNVALGWSQNMATTGVMAHNPAVRSQVVGWSLLGENVGYGNAVTNIFDALVASPKHMRNMSDGEFTRVGLGTVSDATGRLWTTHVFMRPGGSAPTAAPRAAPATAAPAPATTRPVKPASTTVAPTKAPPTTAARVTAPATPATPAPAPSPAGVIVAGRSEPTEAAAPTVLIGSTPAGATSEPGVPAPLLAGAALLGLLVLGATGFAVRRRFT